MPIAVDIDVMLARRKMSVGELADRVGITPANLAVLKNGRAKAVRFATLAALCEVLECQPGDLLRWEAQDAADRTRPPSKPLAGRWPESGTLGWAASCAASEMERLFVSQYYEAGGVTLWNPSSGVSSLFLRQVALFEEEVGLPSGIGPMEADEVEVSLASFEAFVSALLAWRARTGHAVIQGLSDGFIAVCLVLIERAGIKLYWPEPHNGEASEARHVEGTSYAPPVSGWETRVRELAGTLAASMPR